MFKRLFSVLLISVFAFGCGDSSKSSENTQNEQQSGSVEIPAGVYPDNLKKLPVERVVTPEDENLWLAVYELEDPENESSGEKGVIGRKLITSNDARDVKITLDREANLGEYLHLKLHEDDPADETFTYSDNESNDQPVEMTKAGSSSQRDWIGVQVREK